MPVPLNFSTFAPAMQETFGKKRGYLTPEFNPPAPNVGPVAPEVRTREAALPAFNPTMTRSDEYRGLRDEYLANTPGRKKSGLIGALLGGLQGLASGNGLGGAIGGALAGGTFGAINPRGLREQQFEQTVMPRLERQWKMEDMDVDRRQAGLKAAQDTQFHDARLKQIGADVEESQARVRKLGEPAAPDFMNTPRGTMNKATQQIVPGTETLPDRERVFTPQLKFGKSRKTGRLGWYDATNEAKAEDYIPMPEPRSFAPRAAGRGGSGGRDTRAMERAVAEFNQTKRALEKATAANDSAQAAGLRKKLQALSVTIASKYGDQYETGGGEWPYLKAKGAQPPQMADPMGIR
jgi:hypothetical protein